MDIVGHEIAHGVTNYAANLVYSYESGALNESFSDIFGEAIENFATGSNDWQMGTDIGIGGSGAIRSMNNPNAFSDPDTYQGTYWYTGTGDNGGVHINSGVQNKWFYILSVGETGTNDLGNAYNVSGIGIEKAAAIAYRNLTVYLTTNSNYSDARVGAIQSAIDLYGAGSAEEIATTNAWYAVGVGGEYGTISYCSSQGNNASYEWIASVSVGSFTQTSGAAGYSDFTGQTVSVNAGQSYGINLSPGFSGQTYNEYWKIWIDYNGDGDFDDSGELAFDAGGLSSTTVTGSINIPAGASGDTRMRVSMKWNGAQTACETFSYGEVEDYTISISSGGADTQAPTTPGSLTASNTTQTATDLSWSPSSDNVGVTGYNIYVDGILDGTTSATSYTVSGLTASTTYTMEVTAEDAAGNESAPASINVTTQSTGGGGGPTTLLASYFETGWDGWSDGGSDCARYSGSASYEGSYSIQIRDNSGVASSMTSASLDVSSYSQLDIEFYFYPNSMENGEDFWVRYYDGSSWNTIAAYASGSSFTNGNFYVATVSINNTQYNFPGNAQFRFQCDASTNSDQIYIDAVTITGSSGQALQTLADRPKADIRRLEAFSLAARPEISDMPGMDEDEQAPQFEGMSLAPNPVRDLLNVSLPVNATEMRIIGANGAIIRRFETLDQLQKIDVSDLKAGLYFLMVQTTEEVFTKRFVKQ